MTNAGHGPHIFLESPCNLLSLFCHILMMQQRVRKHAKIIHQIGATMIVQVSVSWLCWHIKPPSLREHIFFQALLGNLCWDFGLPPSSGQRVFRGVYTETQDGRINEGQIPYDGELISYKKTSCKALAF